MYDSKKTILYKFCDKPWRKFWSKFFHGEVKKQPDEIHSGFAAVSDLILRVM